MRCRLAGGAVAEPRNLGDDLLRLRLEAQPSIAHPAVRAARAVATVRRRPMGIEQRLTHAGTIDGCAFLTAWYMRNPAETGLHD